MTFSQTSLILNSCCCFNSFSWALGFSGIWSLSSKDADTVSMTQTALRKGQPCPQTAINTVIEQPSSFISFSHLFFSPPLLPPHLLMCVCFRGAWAWDCGMGLHDLFCSVWWSTSLFFLAVLPLCSLSLSLSFSLSLSLYLSIHLSEKIHGLTRLSKRVWQLCPQAIILKMTSLRRHEIINVSQQAATTQG